MTDRGYKCGATMVLRIYLVLVLVLLSFIPNIVKAQISVDNVIVHFASNKRPVYNVIVSNSSPNPAYVLVEVEVLPDPANSGDGVPSPDLLVSPKAFSIEPNGQRTVRLLLRTPPTEIERVFRVGFVPQDRGFGDELTSSLEGRKAIIRVLTGMGILVFADPTKPVSHITLQRTGDRLIFLNDGNVNVYLGDGKSCITKDKCTKLPSKRLYPGKQFEVTVPAGQTVHYLYNVSGSGDYEKLALAADVITDTGGITKHTEPARDN